MPGNRIEKNKEKKKDVRDVRISIFSFSCKLGLGQTIDLPSSARGVRTEQKLLRRWITRKLHPNHSVGPQNHEKESYVQGKKRKEKAVQRKKEDSQDFWIHFSISEGLVLYLSIGGFIFSNNFLDPPVTSSLESTRLWKKIAAREHSYETIIWAAYFILSLSSWRPWT